MSLSELLPIILLPMAVLLYIIYEVIKTYRVKKKKRMPHLNDYIIAEYEKELNRLKKEN